MTPADVANRALSAMGARASVGADLFADASPEGKRMALHYPGAKAQVVEAHPWTWATVADPDINVWPAQAVATLVTVLAANAAFDITANENTGLNLWKLYQTQLAKAWAQDQEKRRLILVRDDVLTRHDWAFARKEIALTLLPTVTITGWPFVYANPSDILMFRGIHNGCAWPSPPVVAFEARGIGIATAKADAIGIYTARIADVSTWPLPVQEAFHAKAEAERLLSDPDTARMALPKMQDAEAAIERAWRAESPLTQHRIRTDFDPPWTTNWNCC